MRLLGLLVFDRFPCTSKSFLHCLSFLYIEINQLGYGLGTSPNQGGGNVRVLLAPYSAISRELLGAAKASLRLGLGHPLYTPWACSLLPPLSVRLLSTEAIAYLITISSSSIDSLVTHARLACSLLYTWAILPHIYSLYLYGLYIGLILMYFFVYAVF